MDEFQQLDLRAQKWVYQQGWPELREIQIRAIPPILAGDRDVLISASTAAGKTEAFFLPACSSIVNQDGGFGILSISPLKALINDQYRRLEGLCDAMDIQVTPWHGDSAIGIKNRAKKDPRGVLLITPESLESLLIRNAGWVRKAFGNLKYVGIDEFHSFIGTERGHHLLSLLNRLEHLLGRLDKPIPRIALSATLGEIKKVPLSLRPNESFPCSIVTSTKSRSMVKVEVRGYVERKILGDDKGETAELKICSDIYKFCRGDSHLVFANSRKRTESIAAKLDDLCAENFVPPEFFPHHGSLAKELREELETRLQKETIPTTAICTMTLELGIDIGKVSSVCQVTAPHSVSSLRQRMGRSGRRNNAAILRLFISENELSKNISVIDSLRLELVQALAMVRLLVDGKWFEPADTSLFHFSTLFHQVLATIAQWGGVRAEQLYDLLCGHGPFRKISVTDFKVLLHGMGMKKLLTQLSSGELTLGTEGERIVNHYSFYAVFKTPEEYRIVTNGKTLGSLPVDSVLLEGEHIIFGGKRWAVDQVDVEKKIIYVVKAHGGNPPLFGGGGLSTHEVVRQEMLKIYLEGDYRIDVDGTKIDFANSSARELFFEGVSNFKAEKLDSQFIIQQGANAYIFPWQGDKVVNTLNAILITEGFKTSAFAGVIEVQRSSTQEILLCLRNLLNNGIPSEFVLAETVLDKYIEKFDEYLPVNLLSKNYGMRAFDSKATHKWLKDNSGYPLI